MDSRTETRLYSYNIYPRGNGRWSSRVMSEDDAIILRDAVVADLDVIGFDVELFADNEDDEDAGKYRVWVIPHPKELEGLQPSKRGKTCVRTLGGKVACGTEVRRHLSDLGAKHDKMKPPPEVARDPDVLFFWENAGWSYNPKKQSKKEGHAETAIALAKAEAEARHRGWSVEWTESSGPWDGEGEPPDELLDALLRDEDGKVLGSLGMIEFMTHGPYAAASRRYGRVVEAELALEALDELKRGNRP